MELARPGEIVHIIERRLFPSGFIRKPEVRTRLISLYNRFIINVLPEGVSVEAIAYSHDAEGNLTLTDGAGFELDISEFSTRE